MTKLSHICYLVIMPLMLTACGHRLQFEEALQDGARQLSRSEIRESLADATIKFSSWDNSEEAYLTLNADGGFKARNKKGERDQGSWRVTDDDRFCLKFNKWLPDEITCYRVAADNNSYQLFNTTGGQEFSFVISGKGWTGSSGALPEKEKTSGETGAVSIPVKAEMRHLLEDGECVGCDLRGESLAGEDLDDADLEGANLAGANLSGADLTDSNLAGADLSGANLREADLRDAVLKNANLSGANLEMARLGEADLEGADLSNARLVDAELDEADLHKANLRGADLHWASLREADLKEADLQGAYLVKTNFQEADLTGANLDNAVIQRTNFKDAEGFKNSEEEEEDSGWWIF